MPITYHYEEGNIEKESTNRLTNISHEESIYDFYLVHPELSEVWELGDKLEISSNTMHNKAGRAIKRVMMMLIAEKMTKNADNLLDYAKRLNRKILTNSTDPIRYDLALEFAYNTIIKGFRIWKQQMLKG